MAKELYQFGPYRLDPSARRLSRGEQPVAITPKAFDTLTVLVLNREQPLSRDELIGRIWPDTVVGEHNLNQCIAVLRRVLEDNPRRPSFIATLPGRGYAFVGDVRVVPKPEVSEATDAGELDRPRQIDPLTSRGSAQRRSVMAAAALVVVAGIALYFARHPYSASAARQTPKPRRSVAVLSLKNLANRSDAAWLSTALPDMLATELGSGGLLRTVSGQAVVQSHEDLKLEPATSLSPQDLEKVGRELDADFLVTGGYTLLPGTDAEGGQLRIDLRLQQAANGETVASVSQEGSMRDLFLLVSRSGAELRQDLGAEAVSQSDASRSRAAVPSNLQAARLYEAGVEKLRDFAAPEARELLEKAVAADPSFPLAHLALADAWQSMGYQANQTAEAKRAWELASGLSRENQLLVEARYLRSVNDWDKTIEKYRALSAFFPDNLDYALGLADVQTRAGRARDALTTLAGLRKPPRPGPDDPRLDLAEARAHAALSDYQEAAQAAGRAAEKARARGARWLAAHALLFEAGALGSAGEAKAAGPVSDQVHSLCQELNDRPCLAVVYRWRGISQVDSDPDSAADDFRDALAIARETGNQSEEENDLNGLAAVASGQGDYRAADRVYEDLLASARQRDDKWDIQMALNNLGNDRMLEARLADARRMEEEAVAVSRQSGQKVGIADGLASLGQILEWQGDLVAAKHAYDEALTVAQEVSGEPTSPPIVAGMAEVLRDRDDLSGARSRAESALRGFSEAGDAANAAVEQTLLAQLSLDEGRPADAVGFARQAAEGLRVHKRNNDEALAQALLARGLAAQQNYREARQAIERSAVLLANSQAQITRLRVGITQAEVEGSLARSGRNVSAAPQRRLRTIAGEARARGILRLEFEARLAEGRLQKALAVPGASRSLASLQDEARAKGFLLVAGGAARSLNRPTAEH
jgi:DNA-binding winged helix-turn-helix (wHTH) protein/TolB-like protein